MHVLALLLAMLIAPPAPSVVRWASPTQGEAFQYGPQPQVASGGWGSGKTWLYCSKALSLSELYPKNRGVIIRAVGKELRATTQATFYKVCRPHLYARNLGGRRNDQEGYLKLAGSQSEILFLHMEDPDTAGIIKGLEINWFFIDQAEEKRDKMEEIFDLLLGRLGRWDVAEVPQYLIDEHVALTGRPWPYVHPEKGTPVPPPYPMLACNPDVEVHWIYRRFHPDSPEHHEKYRALGYRLFDMPSLENQFLTSTNRTFLLAHDAAFIRRNVHGLWGSPEGAIHSVDKLSEVDGSPELLAYFREHCTLFRTMDYGDSAPTAVGWWAVDRNGNVFLFREYYLGNKTISVHRGNIAALSAHEDYDGDLADPSIFHKMPSKQGGRWAVSDEYEDVLEQPRATAIFWKPADNNELGTRNRINEYLRVDPDRIHPITKQPGSPRLFFVKTSDAYPQGVKYALQQVRSQQRIKIGTELGKPIYSDERDGDIVDHAYDVVRYFIASRPPAPPLISPAESARTFSGARKHSIDRRRGLGRLR